MVKRFLFSGTAALLLWLAACKKDDGPAMAAFLTADVYAISTADSAAGGEILVAPFSFTSTDTGQIMVYNGKGLLLWKKDLHADVLDFKKWKYDGKVRYSYFVNDPASYNERVLGAFSGYQVITDSDKNEIKRINLLPHDDLLIDSGQSLDGHDFILLSDNHYIAMAYYKRPTTWVPSRFKPAAAGMVVSPIIQEVDNGQVVWQWDGSKDTSLYADSRIDNAFNDYTTPQDYLHLNSMWVDPRDNNLLVSFRSACMVAKLERGTGRILWRLGGAHSDFPISGNQQFLFQHNFTLVDSNTTFMMYDNGDPATRAYSRILEFKLDEENKKITGFKSFDLLTNNQGIIMGSVQKFGESYFIGGGSGNYVIQINTVTGVKSLEMLGNLTTYRAFKYQ